MSLCKVKIYIYAGQNSYTCSDALAPLHFPSISSLEPYKAYISHKINDLRDIYLTSTLTKHPQHLTFMPPTSSIRITLNQFLTILTVYKTCVAHAHNMC